MKHIITSFLLVCSLSLSWSQTKNLGQPYSFNPKVSITKKSILLPPVDNDKVKATFEEKSKLTGEKNLQYGFVHEVKINFFESATKTKTLTKHNLYQLLIESPKAISLNVIFDNFHLAEGTVMYLFSTDKKKYIGAYTSLNNNKSNQLGTDLIFNDNLVIEVLEPESNENKSSLELGKIVHGFININDAFDKALNDAGGCNIDVNCPQGSGWEAQRNSVGMMVNNTGGFCSGSLVNNTSGTIIPYFLTARHCGTNPGGWIFRFRWETPVGQTNCGLNINSGNGPQDMNINGGITRASYNPSDFHLIELNAIPNEEWGVRYAGWNHSGVPPTSGAGIHHPSGDIKKISISSDEYTPTTYFGSTDLNHWRVEWSEGVTEGGSSGSPIFDQDRRIVGQLHGGASFCGGEDLSDLYGMFSISWEGGGTPASRLKDWLDPQGVSTGTLDANIIHSIDPSISNNIIGIDKVNCSSSILPKVVLQNLGSTQINTLTINYTINGELNTMNWSGNLPSYGIDTISLPQQTFSSGSYNIEVEITNPNGTVDEVLTNNLTSKSFSVVAEGELIDIDLSFDCYASETSWDLRDENQVILYSGSNYNNNGGTAYQYTKEVCLSEACYTFNLYDSYGDGMFDSNCGVEGDVTIMSNYGHILYDLESAAFGSSTTTTFCVSNFSGLDKIEDAAIEVYPNPFDSHINISSSILFDELIIFDALGKIVSSFKFEKSVTNDKIYLELSKGIYMIQLSTKKGFIQKKLIKS
jgi:lysyl endopeptidase